MIANESIVREDFLSVFHTNKPCIVKIRLDKGDFVVKQSRIVLYPEEIGIKDNMTSTKWKGFVIENVVPGDLVVVDGREFIVTSSIQTANGVSEICLVEIDGQVMV